MAASHSCLPRCCQGTDFGTGRFLSYYSYLIVAARTPEIPRTGVGAVPHRVTLATVTLIEVLPSAVLHLSQLHARHATEDLSALEKSIG